MPTFIVNTAILRPQQDPRACAIDAPKKLMSSGIRDLKVRSCYCCSEYGSAIFVIDGASREDVLDGFRRINVPVASIMQAEEIKQIAASPMTE